MADVLGSAEAREQLPQLIDVLVKRPTEAIEVGRHRRREVVMINAERYDAMCQEADALNELAWALFARERIENPTSAPVSWEEAQRRRRRG